MDLKRYTLSIVRGDGLVARFNDVVMYIADTTSTTERLLAAVNAVADSEHLGAALAARLAELVFRADADDVAPFAIVAPTADGLLVLVRGIVIAVIDAEQGTRELTGQRAFTWVDEIVPAPVRQITITGGSRASVHPHTDLHAGIVPGGGFVLCDRDATKERSARAKSVAAETMRGLEPTQSAPSPAETAPGRQAPMETSAHVPVPGTLESEDGVVYPLDRNYVIGRDPLRDDTVRTAAASPIILHHDQHISRVHAYISIDRAAVFVRDASTPGGTFIAAPGTEDWTRIGTTPTELKPGCSLRVGDRILTYHAGNQV